MKVAELPDDDPETKIPEIYVFYDFEAQQDTGTHLANLVVARWTCTNCLDLPLDTTDRQKEIDSCKLCRAPQKDREIHFSVSNTASDFCEWLFKPQPDPIQI